MKTLLRGLGGNLLHKAAREHSGEGGLLDARSGWKMLRDRTVPFSPKLAAVALGGLLTVALMALEFPLESILALVLPGFGFAADFLVDGAEMIVGPIVFASILLPHLLPKAKSVMQESHARRTLPPPSYLQR